MFGVKLFQARLFICSVRHLSLDGTVIFPCQWKKASDIYNLQLIPQDPITFSDDEQGVYNHLRNERYLGIKGIGSLGISWPHGPWTPMVIVADDQFHPVLSSRKGSEKAAVQRTAG